MNITNEQIEKAIIKAMKDIRERIKSKRALPNDNALLIKLNTQYVRIKKGDKFRITNLLLRYIE